MRVTAVTNLVTSKITIVGPHVEFIYCACGCGRTRSKYDTHNNKERKYIKNHDKRELFLGKKRSLEVREKISEGHKGDKAPWFGKHLTMETKRKLSDSRKKNGTLNKFGYRFIKVLREDKPSRKRLEHRAVYEEYYNCCLLNWVDIHHKNGNKLDNSIENLEPIAHGKHTILHKRK